MPDKCARCGLTDSTVLDLGTGSTCHPELQHCVKLLQAEVERLKGQRTLAVNEAARFQLERDTAVKWFNALRESCSNLCKALGDGESITIEQGRQMADFLARFPPLSANCHNPACKEGEISVPSGTTEDGDRIVVYLACPVCQPPKELAHSFTVKCHGCGENRLEYFTRPDRCDNCEDVRASLSEPTTEMEKFGNFMCCCDPKDQNDGCVKCRTRNLLARIDKEVKDD